MYKCIGFGTIAGWGKLSENGDSAYALQQVTISLMDKGYCDQNLRRIGNSQHLNQCQICAGEQYGGRDACQV